MKCQIGHGDVVLFFCDILNYIFTQIFIIDIQKMIMQQTLFIVILAVAIAFVLAYRWKKRQKTKWTI